MLRYLCIREPSIDSTSLRVFHSVGAFVLHGKRATNVGESRLIIAGLGVRQDNSTSGERLITLLIPACRLLRIVVSNPKALDCYPVSILMARTHHLCVNVEDQGLVRYELQMRRWLYTL